MNHCIDNFKTHQHVQSRLIVDGCSSLSPDISIVIPTYRRPHLIKETIASVIRQSMSDACIELVIVDNDAESIDGELEKIVSELLPFNIRLFRNDENIGMFGNWNRCIVLARAPVLTILNDDDLLHPDFIRSVYKPGMKEMRVVSHKIFARQSDCNWLDVKSNIQFSSVNRADFFIGDPVPGSLGMLMNKQCAIDVGGYNESRWPTADYDFTYRYWLKYGLSKTSQYLSAYRWAENESLKLETLVGFLKNDYGFRNGMISSSNCSALNKYLLSICNTLLLVRAAYIYNGINPCFDVKDNLNVFKIPKSLLLSFRISIIRKFINRLVPLVVKVIF